MLHLELLMTLLMCVKKMCLKLAFKRFTSQSVIIKTRIFIKQSLCKCTYAYLRKSTSKWASNLQPAEQGFPV